MVFMEIINVKFLYKLRIFSIIFINILSYWENFIEF